MVGEQVRKEQGAFHESTETPDGFGVRRQSAAATLIYCCPCGAPKVAIHPTFQQINSL
jgi:hypothetical protein